MTCDGECVTLLEDGAFLICKKFVLTRKGIEQIKFNCGTEEKEVVYK